MITLQDNILSGEVTLTSADTVVKLTTDIDAIFHAKLTFKNGMTKAFKFIKENDYYKCRILLTKEDTLVGLSLAVSTASENTVQTSNSILVTCDQDKIRQSLKVSASNDIYDLKVKIAQIEKQLCAITTGKTLDNLEVKYDTIIKPGMVPMTINDSGECTFQYPFSDVITEINGQKSTNSSITLTADDIQASDDKTIKDTLKQQAQAIVSLTTYLNTLSSQLKALTTKVSEIETKLLEHTESSII